MPSRFIAEMKLAEAQGAKVDPRERLKAQRAAMAAKAAASAEAQAAASGRPRLPV